MPIGDPDGALESINVAEENSKLRRNISAQEEQEIVQKLAWVHNQYLPIAGWNEVNSPRYIRNDKWNFPGEDHEMWEVDRASRWIPHGLLTAKTQ